MADSLRGDPADPVHGQQEGEAYRAYSGQHRYHPLLIFNGDTNQLITAILRSGNAHASRGGIAGAQTFGPPAPATLAQHAD